MPMKVITKMEVQECAHVYVCARVPTCVCSM